MLCGCQGEATGCRGDWTVSSHLWLVVRYMLIGK